MRGMMERGGEGGMMVGFCVFDVDEIKGGIVGERMLEVGSEVSVDVMGGEC